MTFLSDRQLKMMIFRGIFVTLIFGLTMLCMICLMDQQSIGYDCQLAEISPDVPISYKKACRESKKKSINKFLNMKGNV